MLSLKKILLQQNGEIDKDKICLGNKFFKTFQY